jgi:hypothetical protein
MSRWGIQPQMQDKSPRLPVDPTKTHAVATNQRRFDQHGVLNDIGGSENGTLL